jgi:hypothetical protein
LSVCTPSTGRTQPWEPCTGMCSSTGHDERFI